MTSSPPGEPVDNSNTPTPLLAQQRLDSASTSSAATAAAGGSSFTAQLSSDPSIDDPSPARTDNLPVPASASEQQPRFSAEQKGKGRAVDEAEHPGGVHPPAPPAPPDVAPASPAFDAEARALASSLKGYLPSAVDPDAPTPVELSPVLKPVELPAAPQSPLPPSEVVAEEEEEDRWLLKRIAWPPLPPRPSAEQGGEDQGMETMGQPTVAIVCQNKNGPCSLLALCTFARSSCAEMS